MAFGLLSLGLPFLLLLSLAAAAPTPEALSASGNDSGDESEEINWQCGTDFLTKYISEGQIDQDCPTLKVPINNCCLAHDKCYDDQLGRQHCDDVFCACLEAATRPSRVCSEEDGPLFCTLVRELGDDAYINAARNTSSNDYDDNMMLNDTHEVTTVSQIVQHQVARTEPTPVREEGSGYYVRLYDSLSSRIVPAAGGFLLDRMVKYFAPMDEHQGGTNVETTLEWAS